MKRQENGPGILAGQTFEEAIAEVFGFASVPSMRTVSLKSAQITMTRTNTRLIRREITPRSVPQKAFVMSLPLRPFVGHELWKFGKLHTKEAYPQDSISLLHWEEEPQGVLPDTFDVLQFQLPELALLELSEDGRVPSFDAFWRRASYHDPVIGNLGRALAAALECANCEKLFFDHVVLAIHSHLVGRYSSAKHSILRPGGLSIGQERKAKELLAADLSADPSITQIASKIGIPAGRFGTAFRVTTGLAPYDWRRRYRIETAKSLLFGSALTLAEIAIACGFSDQSHFTRVFSKLTGVTPGAWRRRR